MTKKPTAAPKKATKKAPSKPSKPTKVTKTSPAKDAPTDPAPTPAKVTKKEAKPETKTEKGPGVIKSLVEFLKGATAAKPLNKAALLEMLAERFPERPQDSMAKTINAQIPTRIQKEQKITIHKNEDGYWADK